ncbi:MAG: hypothetical protein KDA66_18795, partial [Planctomycetaceae bacterium]|nr:hypothetical protein [Planctomycetaceae bacterium]
MSVFKGFLAGLSVGAVLALFALNYHVVHTANGHVVIARTTKAPFRSAYVDVRKWSDAMWQQHPEVAAALAQSGHADAITNSVLEQNAQQVSVQGEPLFGTIEEAIPAEVRVPIRFFDEDGQVVESQRNEQNVETPAGRPESSESIPWEEFLRRSQQTSVPDSQSQYEPKPTSQPLDESLLTASADSSVLPSLFQSAKQSSAVESLRDTMNDLLVEESNALFGLEEPVDQQAAVPQNVQRIDPRTEAPEREWVRGMLQSLIPESTIPGQPDTANDPSISLPTALLDAPSPTSGMQSGSLLNETSVVPP